MHGCQHSHKHTVNDATYTRSRSLPHTDPRSLSAEQQHFHARRAASRRTKKHYYFSFDNSYRSASSATLKGILDMQGTQEQT